VIHSPMVELVVCVVKWGVWTVPVIQHHIERSERAMDCMYVNLVLLLVNVQCVKRVAAMQMDVVLHLIMIVTPKCVYHAPHLVMERMARQCAPHAAGKVDVRMEL